MPNMGARAGPGVGRRRLAHGWQSTPTDGEGRRMAHGCQRRPTDGEREGRAAVGPIGRSPHAFTAAALPSLPPLARQMAGWRAPTAGGAALPTSPSSPRLTVAPDGHVAVPFIDYRHIHLTGADL